MENSINRSFFQDIRSRELHGFRVRKRPYIADDSPEFIEIGALAFEHESTSTPPMALSFCKTSKNAHILAVTGEDGYISLYNTRLKCPSANHKENADKARICEWLAHDNAIFDICWIKEDTNLLTACGDHSIKVWDPQERKCLGALLGHTGSVKSISPHPTNSDLVVSGSRDGSFALWDLRCSKSRRTSFCTSSLATVQGAHTSSTGTRGRHGKSASMSITSVLYLKNEVSIATAGAVDSIVKFWDARSLKVPIIQACPHGESSKKSARSHGISSLSQDLNGVHISVSCMDSRIYLYDTLHLEKGPTRTFSGCNINTFFVKAAISPDGGHILSGSSDGNACIWQVNKPQAGPIVLKGHDEEVTAVDWCSSEMGKIATSADDYTVRFWNINSSCYSNTRSPSSIRRRLMPLPKMGRRKLFMEEESNKVVKEPKHGSAVEVSAQSDSLDQTLKPELRTPESVKKQSSSLYVKETCEETPEASLSSPSSVLNPPSSLKRKTILDYFLVPS